MELWRLGPLQQAGSVYSVTLSLCLWFDFALQCGGGTELRLVRCQDHLGQVTTPLTLFLSFVYLLIFLDSSPSWCCIIPFTSRCPTTSAPWRGGRRTAGGARPRPAGATSGGGGSCGRWARGAGAGGTEGVEQGGLEARTN